MHFKAMNFYMGHGDMALQPLALEVQIKMVKLTFYRLQLNSPKESGALYLFAKMSCQVVTHSLSKKSVGQLLVCLCFISWPYS